MRRSNTASGHLYHLVGHSHAPSPLRRRCVTTSLPIVNAPLEIKNTNDDGIDQFLETFYTTLLPTTQWHLDTPKLKAEDLYVLQKRLGSMDRETGYQFVIDLFAQRGRLSVSEALVCFQSLML